MRRSQLMNFRPAFLGDVAASETSAIVDTDGYLEAVWMFNFDLDDPSVDQILSVYIQASSTSDFSSGNSLPYTAGTTLTTSGATSTTPGDKDMRVVSIRLAPDLPGRRYQRLVISRTGGSGASDIKLFAVCGLRHGGEKPMTNAECAGTNGEAVIGTVPPTAGGAI